MNQFYNPFQETLTKSGLYMLGISLQYTMPCKSLRGIVHSYLEINTTRPTPYPIMPDGTQALFISTKGSIIGGTQSKASNLQILQAGMYFGVRFFPGALRHFFKLNLAEITDQYVDSQYFPCKIFHQLHHKVYECSTFEKRAEIYEKWLLKLFKPMVAGPLDHAMLLIYQSFGNIKVGHLSILVDLSTRHLNRLFRYHTGLSTKLFIETIRIQNVYKRLSSMPNESLATAFDLGFYDQAHLLNEYKKRLLSNRGTFIEHFMSDFYNS